MISEKQKYLSGMFKSFGFTCLAPFGTLLFQWIISKDGAYFEHFWYSIASLFLGIIFLQVGYNLLEGDRKNA